MRAKDISFTALSVTVVTLKKDLLNVCVCVCTRAMACVQRSEDSLWESFLVFPKMEPGHQPELSGLVASVFYTLAYLVHENNF